MKKIIWIDFENAPHVWVFKEFIEELIESEFSIVITARDFSQTIAIAKLLKIKIDLITNRKLSKNNFSKLFSIVLRSNEINQFWNYLNIIPNLALSHGSRTQAISARKKNILAYSLDDFEKSFLGFNLFVNKILSPFPIKPKYWGKYKDKIVNYPGLKEELYLWNNENLEEDLSNIIDDNYINILFRPESVYSHYYSEKSSLIQKELLLLFKKNRNDINVILIPREDEQKDILKNYFKDNKINYTIPTKAVKGPALINASDIVFSGGGTMIREACMLNIPAYSFFCSEVGMVDKYLENSGKLTFLNTKDALEKMKFIKKSKNNKQSISKEPFNFVYEFIKKPLID